MQRKRGELVPIGEASSGLDGPVKAIREASPQARHHFTLADQVNQLVSASDKRTVLNFRRKILRELKKIKLAWPDLNYTTAPGLLILHPSTPGIAPLNQAQLTS